MNSYSTNYLWKKIGHDVIVGVHEFHYKDDNKFKEGNDSCQTNESIDTSSQEEKHETSQIYTSSYANEFISLDENLCPQF